MTRLNTESALPYALNRVGVLMNADPADPLEAEGVLNPATAWGPDGELYLFPRMVAAGNVSRIGRARVVIEDGVPVGVERQGVVLSPDEGFERGAHNAGVEDPRITFIPDLGVHVMTYVAYGPLGPRPALAVSTDTISWRRLGPLHFTYQSHLSTDLNFFPNKDLVFFPEIVPGPDGRASFAMLHRPMWDLDWLRAGEGAPAPAGVADGRPSIWIAYVDAEAARRDLSALTSLRHSAPVAAPEMPFEVAKIGAGPPPLRVPEGWLLIHHGVTGPVARGFELSHGAVYRAGGMLLDPDDPARVLARSQEPWLSPETREETVGTLGNVVFPTAIERIAGTVYVFYGMADSAIGVAALERTAD
ncbi:glycoside hydrolase family 130 protein [Streptomyces rugosispiralis]|uniref:Glycosidase n=1 Tax=Streptomyces rugosispiralis TaxID=2967341 RepID=A0ABT1VAL5_9ACTN|nr:glycosidase [Streptomyces rugosispiralis]MCQ8194426.1 glycosidase [Streptomyces rugosispiralis]